MSNNEIPFYTQTAILDRYLHRTHNEISSEIVESIVDLLQNNSELRAYFFRNTPHPDWAHILWDRGFFNTPPNPLLTQNGYVLPRWDVQDFLIGIASQVPDVVVKHVEVIDGQGWYISQALRALKEVPVNYVEKSFPRLMQILDRPVVDRMVSEYIYEIMVSFAENNLVDMAFALFESMTEPIMIVDEARLAQTLYKDEANSKNDSVFADWKKDDLAGLFSRLDAKRTIATLDKHLRKALILEERDLESPSYKKGSYWRSSIEDSDQNHFLSYKEKLLQKLRIAVDGEMNAANSFIKNTIREYLAEEMNIFRRVGIHFVREYPKTFLEELQSLLNEYKNLDDYFIHHEFFLLLRDGFSYMDESKQQKLVQKILEGPPNKTIDDYRRWGSEFRVPENLSIDAYTEIQIRNWIFTRLWMIRDHLTGNAKEIFAELFQEIGEPSIPPEFTSYLSSFSRIQDVSPLSINEISAFSPPNLIIFLKEWKPDTSHSSWPNEQTYLSLGLELAKVIFENPNKYKDFLFDIAMIRPAYGNAIVIEFSNLAQRSDELWILVLGISEKLMGLEEVRLANNPGLNDNWYYFKRSLLELIRGSFSDPQKSAPHDLLQKIKNILLILVNDPDPSEDHDKPSKDTSTFNDPSHVALNSIRPTALNILITYAIEEHKLQYEKYTHELGPKRLSVDIQNVLDAKLNVNIEPSWAVRSVFGERLVNLFWLDKKWTEDNLEKIFPSFDDEESMWFFVSAVSSYVVFRNFFFDLYEVLKPIYRRAIELFSKGYLWKTHLQPVSHLAAHIVWSYLEFDSNIDFSKLNDDNLMVKFFLSSDGEGRKDGAFICRRVLDTPENVEKYWDKLRRLWEWRAQEAVQAGHTNDFDGEMLQFAQLISVSPATETIQSLWPILTATVPHFHGLQYRDWGWDAVEDFLAKKVEAEPLLAIKLYSMMYERAMPPKWFERRQEARNILEVAVKDERSKQVACDLINFIGSRLEDDRFRDLYEKYC